VISKRHKKQALEYLDKNYCIQNKKILRKHDGCFEWGLDVIESLAKTLAIDIDECGKITRAWSNLSSDEWGLIIRPLKLKFQWSPELAQDIAGFNEQQPFVEVISEELFKELRHPILINAFDRIKHSNELLGVIRCLGYILGPTIYDEVTFAPRKPFIAMTENEIINEQQNNAIWQDWVRTSEQNQEA